MINPSIHSHGNRLSLAGGTMTGDIVFQENAIIRHVNGADRGYIKLDTWTLDLRYNTVSALTISTGIIVNNNGGDRDFLVHTQVANTIFAEGSSGKVGINNQTPSSLLDVRGAVGAAGILTLSTAEPTVIDGNELGRINFQAPLETGTDAILVSAAIWAEADNTFSATVNQTSLVFATGASEVAAEKMRLTSDGELRIKSVSTYNYPEFRLDTYATGLSVWANTRAGLISNGVGVMACQNAIDVGMFMKSTLPIGWGNAEINGAPDTFLYRDAAHIIAQRNSTNTQEFRIYETWTDASNYERGTIKFDSGYMVIGTDDLGDGTASGLKLQTDSTDRVTITAAGLVGIGVVPTQALHIEATAYPQIKVVYSGSTYCTIDHAATIDVYNNDWFLKTNGTTRLTIDEDTGATTVANNLTVGGAKLATTVRAVSDGGELFPADVWITCAPSGGNINIEIPTAQCVKGRYFYIKDINGSAYAYSITLWNETSYEKIDGSTRAVGSPHTVINTAWGSCMVVCTSASAPYADWHVFGMNDMA